MTGNITKEEVEEVTRIYLEQERAILDAANPGRDYSILLGRRKITKRSDGSFNITVNQSVVVWHDGKGEMKVA